MNLQRDSRWKRRGFSLLWDAQALSEVISLRNVASLREFIAIAKSWPELLPGSNGDALVVAGVEGCLDALTDTDGKQWLETDLKEPILKFQEEYQGQAALILWFPSGRSRISMVSATEEYYWKRSAQHASTGLPIGRCLWAGAESDAARIIVSNATNPDPDGDAYVGLFHPRIS